jgi:hypothetical protein
MRTVRSTYSGAVALPETAIPEQPRRILRRAVTGESEAKESVYVAFPFARDEAQAGETRFAFAVASDAGDHVAVAVDLRAA